VFPSTNNFNMTGDEFANGLLESQKVAVVPGSAFGRSGELHVRISYAYSMKSLEKATERIEKYIEVIK
ncbi:MAG: pyridoxal phosphate-dependent aminotransferase, partial [Clostridia bacterium]